MSDSAEPFLSRWSRLKRGDDEEIVKVPASDTGMVSTAEPNEEEALLSDADMPPIESLSDDDDFSGFLNAGVSPDLRQKALWRLFRSAKFNVTDGLDDYAEDFTRFAPLGDIVTADMKHQMERLLAAEESVEEEASLEAGTEETEVQVQSTDVQTDDGRTDDASPESENAVSAEHPQG